MLHLKLFNSIKISAFNASKTGLFSRQLTPSFFIHTQHAIKQEQAVVESEPKHYSPVEFLREKAFRIENEANLRSRCRWTEEETEKLMKLVSSLGKRWTAISNHFVDRSPSNVMNHYLLKTEQYIRGPWSKEELKALKKLGNNRSFDDITDWESIQMKLPNPRPIFMIRQTYKHSLDPRIKHGRWTEEESDLLERLVMKYGEENMATVANLMATRTKRQCLERWRWQLANIKKGRFSSEEDRLILDAVKKYGENFAVICKVTGIERTPRHVSQHYNTILNPSIDRSPWTEEEEEKVYSTCVKNSNNMLKTREELGSKRAIRDMWNHFHRYKRYHAKRLPTASI